MDLTEDEYLQLEDALLQTARGRAFLRMRDRRARVVAIDEFTRTVADLQKQVDRLRGAEPGLRPAPPTGADGAHMPEIHRELSEISQFVQQTRSDIAALKPVDSGANRVEAATAELDAIVAATESATSDILSATEKIQEHCARIPRDDPELAEIADSIEMHCIEVMTACSFQDITGQRTTKVVNTLRYIEHRVNTMIEIWGVDRMAGAAATAEEAATAAFTASHRKMNDTRPDAHLLNGPALGDGIGQSQIDALFDQMASTNPEVFDRMEEAPAPPPPPPPSPPPPPAKPAPKRKAEPAPAASGGDAPSCSQADIDAMFD